ncbi:hypothetical protein [Frigoriflavimonas asaccharolytica]|uniref:Lipoprotein n=1 Tax=Frigoriflavimonas asaccharolytica TaxID=2735899 RepID=A0A8J8K515_9FLAO|nr:hypothetical protein [Frigoriflavimonas asaccharolytica]NRS92340.1 hypothetical protein [Frigoriflavimonas asaccharolytica]
MKFKLFSLIILSIIFSCKNEKLKKVSNDDYKRWDELEIETRYQTLTIFKFSDSAEFINVKYDKGIYEIPPKYNNKKIEKKVILFTKQERDSLSKYIFQSVIKPSFTNTSATDYVGNVSLKFKRHNMNLICEYYSVGDWTEISEETKKIFNIINSKVEISKQ